jgi:hypothetical protein
MVSLLHPPQENEKVGAETGLTNTSVKARD